MPVTRSAMPPRPAIPKLLQPAIFYRRPAQTLDWCRRRYGDAFTLWIPPWGDVAVFTSPAAAKTIFKKDAQALGLDGGRAYKAVFNMLMGPHSMFAVEGDEHLRLRRMLVRAFKRRNPEEHRAPIEQIAVAEVDGWPVGQRFSFEHAMQQLTLAVVIRDIFGVTDRDHERELRSLLPEIVNPGMLIQLEVAFPAIRKLGPARRHHRVMAQTRSVLADIVARRRGVDDLDQRIDIFSLLLAGRDDDGQPLTENELVDFLMTLLLAGHETTAAQLTWVMDLLLRNPDALARLREDLAAGNEDYLEAAIKEAMRLRPALPYVERGITDDVEIEGYHLRAGTTVGVGIAAVHHAQDSYEDPQAFRPERFLDGPGPRPHEWIPWGGGRRRCAGLHFATVEMKATVSTIVQRVDLATCGRRPEAAAGKAVTMVPRRGGQMIVRKRLVPAGAALTAATPVHSDSGASVAVAAPPSTVVSQNGAIE